MPQLALIIFGNWALGGGAIGSYYIPLHVYSWFVYSSSYQPTKGPLRELRAGFFRIRRCGFYLRLL